MRVLLADRLSPATESTLTTAGCAVTVDPSLKDDALTGALLQHNPQVVVVRSTRIRVEHLEAAPALTLIIRAGAGTNTIDVNAAAARGIYVANCPGKNAIAVAELTIGHLINLDRRIADNVHMLRQHRWEKKKFSSSRGLHGRTLAVLGAGQIGQEVILRAHAFGMHVRVWSRSLTPARAEELGVTFAATPLAACQDADALTIHLALTDKTRKMVDASLLCALKPGAYVINTSRGGVVDQAALIEAIHTRNLRAGLDVFAQEPGSGDHDFSDSIAEEPSVYGTHHIGASTDQASDAVGNEVARIVLQYLQTGDVLNCVNLAEQTPATHLLVVRHLDKIGVLANVLGILREEDINVQEMENIIFKGAAAACARIQIDRTPTDNTLARLNASSDIFATSLVALEN